MWIQVYDQGKRGPRGEAFCQLLRSLNKCKQSCISLRQALRRPVSSVSGRRRKHGCGCQSWSIRRASFVSSRRPFGMVLRRYLRYPAPQRMQPAHGKRIFNLDDGRRLRMGGACRPWGGRTPETAAAPGSRFGGRWVRFSELRLVLRPEGVKKAPAVEDWCWKRICRPLICRGVRHGPGAAPGDYFTRGASSLQTRWGPHVLHRLSQG